MRALYTAATGMAAQELNVQVISNNIANLRTTGYKKQRAAFQDLIESTYGARDRARGQAATVAWLAEEVGELAAPHDMALTSFMKHLKVLERSGWIVTAKTSRVRTRAIVTDRFADVGAWVYNHRGLWADSRSGQVARAWSRDKVRFLSKREASHGQTELCDGRIERSDEGKGLL